MSKRITVTLDDRLFDFIESHSVGESKSRVINRIIENYYWAKAATLYVSPDGKDPYGQPCAKTIQEAIESCQEAIESRNIPTIINCCENKS